MLLSAVVLENVANVNAYSTGESVRFTEGDGQTVYIQLVDLTQNQREATPGRRYMPGAGATLQCSVLNIDDAKKLVKFASQPFPLDPSIWSFNIMPTDPLRGSADLRLLLTEGGKVTNGVLRAAFSVQPLRTAF